MWVSILHWTETGHDERTNHSKVFHILIDELQIVIDSNELYHELLIFKSLLEENITALQFHWIQKKKKKRNGSNIQFYG